MLFKCFLTPILLSLLWMNPLWSQVHSINQKLPATIEIKMQVKQLEQFINRFNYTEIFRDKESDRLFKEKYDRKVCIQTLFNHSDKRITNKLSFDSSYHFLCNTFTNQMINDSILISKNPEKVYAKVECRIKRQGKKQNIHLYFKKVFYPNGASCWKLFQIGGENKSPMNYSYNNNICLPPNAHETSFLKLTNTILNENLKNQYITKSESPDALGNFIYEVWNKKILIEYFDNVELFLFDIPGWIVVVKDFLREGTNSGWLIDDIIQADKESKTKYIADTFDQ